MHTATNTELSIFFRPGGWRACVVRAGPIGRADSCEEILSVTTYIEDRLKDEGELFQPFCRSAERTLIEF